jgi:hypothetical protein
MIRPMRAAPGLALAARPAGTIFFGTRTGLANLAGSANAREEAVRLMRASGLPFVGGIVADDVPADRAGQELLVARVSRREHARLLAGSKLCLAPWGNHVLTYRLFEGLAARCLVLAQSIRGTSFIDGGLEPGRHFVEVAPDLGDLVDKARYYLQHLDEAQRIADAGHRHFAQFFAARGSLLSKPVFDATVASWGLLYSGPRPGGVAATLRSLAARWFPRKF